MTQLMTSDDPEDGPRPDDGGPPGDQVQPGCGDGVADRRPPGNVLWSTSSVGLLEARASHRILLNGRIMAELAIPPESVWRPAVRAPASTSGSRPCVYVLETDGLVGSTRIEFVRSR